MRAPSSASFSAMPRPIPRELPVINANFPLSDIHFSVRTGRSGARREHCSQEGEGSGLEQRYKCRLLPAHKIFVTRFAGRASNPNTHTRLLWNRGEQWIVLSGSTRFRGFVDSPNKCPTSVGHLLFH